MWGVYLIKAQESGAEVTTQIARFSDKDRAQALMENLNTMSYPGETYRVHQMYDQGEKEAQNG